MGSRTSNGNGRDARGQEKGKGRSYDSDPDQDFDGAVGDDSIDPLDFLTGQQTSRRKNPLPSFTKKTSGMKAKNGLKVGDEIVDVDIEEGKKGGSKKKNQQVSYEFFYRESYKRIIYTDRLFLSLSSTSTSLELNGFRIRPQPLKTSQTILSFLLKRDLVLPPTRILLLM